MKENQLSFQAKAYIIILALAALTITTYLFLTMNWGNLNWYSFFLFLFLTFLFDSYPVKMPRGGVVSVTFAITFASILIFEPLAVVIIVVFGDLLSLRKGRSPAKYIFNASQLALSSGVASLVYTHIYPFGIEMSFNYFLAAVVSLLICFFLNSAFVTLILAFVQNSKPYSIWLTNMKWSAPNFLSMAPLGIIMAVIFVDIGFWGLILFLIPLTLARHSFQSYMNMRRTFLDTIQSLSVAIDAKDPYTKGHSIRVAEYAVTLARELKWPEDRVEALRYLALIHDVGKISTPENILKKDSVLTEEEFNKMKNHSIMGAEIVSGIKFFVHGAETIKHHHERWDGTGYPDGLQGEQIPEGARILAVADAFDAMTSDRPYRRALDPLSALQEISKGAGNQFDPRAAEAFKKVFHRLDLAGKQNLYRSGTSYGGLVAAENEPE